MVSELSRNDIIEIAIQTENKGIGFYEAMQRHARKASVGKVFGLLADEEKKHIDAFEKLRGTEGRLRLKSPLDWEEVEQYFRVLAEHQVLQAINDTEELAKESEAESDIIQIAITLEKENILFFHEMAELVGEEDERLLSELIDQEKNHIRLLLALKEELEVSESS